jgi:ribosome-binding protein aMBF1 (putative translation factor)
VAPPEKVDRTVGQTIAKARQEKEPKMTQKALAASINETATVIQSYESAFDYKDVAAAD